MDHSTLEASLGKKSVFVSTVKENDTGIILIHAKVTLLITMCMETSIILIITILLYDNLSSLKILLMIRTKKK